MELLFVAIADSSRFALLDFRGTLCPAIIIIIHAMSDAVWCATRGTGVMLSMITSAGAWHFRGLIKSNFRRLLPVGTQVLSSQVTTPFDTAGGFCMSVSLYIWPGVSGWSDLHLEVFVRRVVPLCKDYETHHPTDHTVHPSLAWATAQ